MKTFAFYVVGKKGHSCLASFIKLFGSRSVAYVIGARDKGAIEDHFPEIESLCSDNGVPFFERTQRQALELKKPDYSFAIGWKWIILSGEKLIVLHDSILPKYRGFAPLVSMLINGETFIGVTAFLASEDYDRGPIVAQYSVNISYPIRIEEAIDCLLPIYSRLVIEIAGRVIDEAGLSAVEQDDSEATYSLWRDEEDYIIDWSNDSKSIKRFIDAVGYPYKGAASRLNGVLVRVLDADLVEDVEVEGRLRHLGKVIYFRDESPVVICGTGLLKLNKIVIDNEKAPINEVSFRSRFVGLQ